MIFATVGTTKFPFNRLLKKADELMIKKGGKEKLVVQKGESNYKFQYPYVEIFKEVDFSQFVNFLKKANLVITHGGPATIFLCLKYCKYKPIIIPRLKKFREHVDDHQYYFNEFLRKKSIFVKNKKNNIKNLVNKLDQYCQGPK